MSMIMNHDMTSIMGQRIMNKNSLAMKRSLEKLSTGLRTQIADLDNTAELAILRNGKSSEQLAGRSKPDSNGGRRFISNTVDDEQNARACSTGG